MTAIKRMFGALVIAVFVFSFCFIDAAFAADEYLVLVKVDPKTVAMPGNLVSRVPVRYARIRSTELRELIDQYNIDGSATIEKVYDWVKEGNNPYVKVEVPDTYVLRFGKEYINETAIDDFVRELTSVTVLTDANRVASVLTEPPAE